jgi:speckle-type POZ protein
MRPEAQITSLGSAALHFRVDYEQAKQLPIGQYVQSGVFSAGGHPWRIECFPCGVFGSGGPAEYLAIYLRHMGKSRSVRALFVAFLLDRDGQPCSKIMKGRTFMNSPANEDCDDDSEDNGWLRFVKAATLEKDYVFEGHVTFVCAILVIHDSPEHQKTGDSPIPSDIGSDLGRLLDQEDGTDLSFIVDGEIFRVHRAVIAARSPVFRAELFGSMAEATMSSITLQDITPATFKAMLRFMYTDKLPGEDELVDYSVEMFQDILAAADRYALDGLKLMCAQKLWDYVTVDTVAAILASAETYNCPKLKKECFNFFAVENNFKKAVFTDGFAMLVQKFPSLTAELRERIVSCEII